MTFSRWWTETTASLGDRVPLPLAALLLVLGTVLVAVAWYTYPAWVPRRLPRLRLPRLRLPRRARRGRRAAPPAGAAPGVPTPRQPETVPAAGSSLADRLAAQGRYAEAVRERLRTMVRELAARRVVTPEPGMTVVELVAAAAASDPRVEPPLDAAGAIFSELWYARRTATAEHDRRMRTHADELRRLLTGEAS